MKKCIISIKLNITEWLPGGWEKLSDEEIKEYLGDTPEAIEECFNGDGLYIADGEINLVKKVERIGI